MRSALPREEVVKAVEHRNPARVPMMIHQWNGAEVFEDRADQVSEIQSLYPQDAHFMCIRQPWIWDDVGNPDHIPGYSWMPVPPPQKTGEAHGHDAQVAITDWSQLDDILAKWPDPNTPGIFPRTKGEFRGEADGRYTCIMWFFCFYEWMWSLRGMENILCDFYENPQHVHRFMDALMDFHSGMIERIAKEFEVDAVCTTDDLGMQTGAMFGLDIFREFFKHRYAKLMRVAHERGMHFWLHACGDVRLFLDDFIEIGLDVIHPIQKYAMDEREVAERFGERLCFWAGMDCQQILPRGTPEDVRREVRFMIDTYDRPDGGCMITAGNAVTPDVPIENLLAFYDETYNYGLAHRQRWAGT